MKKRNDSLIYLFIVALTLFIYKNTLHNYFCGDDFFYIINRNNPNLYSPLTYFFYQPITFLFYYLNYFWSGFNPFGYRLFQILTASFTLCFVYYISLKLSKNRFIALFISIFGIVYYVSSDNLLWINCTNNVICGFFYMLTLIYSIKYNETLSKKHYILMLLFLNLTLYTREMGVTVFLSVVFIDLVFYTDRYDKKSLFKLIKKHKYSILSGFIYLFIMALGPSLRYGKLTFNRGAYKLIFNLEDIIVNINWFYFKLFFPVSFGSHFKLPWLFNIIYFIRMHYISLYVLFFLCLIIRNRYFYFGMGWVLITAAPYLLLDRYMVHTGERYFYMPHLMFGFIILGICVYLKTNIKNKFIHKAFLIFFTIFLIFYSIGSCYAINKRIGWWQIAGNESKKFVEATKKRWDNIPNNSILFIKNIPRYASNAPNKLIVLLSGADMAIKMAFNKTHKFNIDVSAYWADDMRETIARIPENKKYQHFYFAEYDSNAGILKDWSPDTNYLNEIRKKIQILNKTNFQPIKQVY